MEKLHTVARVALAGLIAATMALGQAPAFDAASVKRVQLASHPAFGNKGGPGTTDPGRIHLCCVGMFSLLMRAYDVEIDQIIGPSWIMENMGPNLYQVDATMPPNITKVQFQLMMQNLLKERFHVEVRRQTRNFPGYELVVAEGGPRFRESKPYPEAGTPDGQQIPKRSADGALVLPAGPQLFTSLGRGAVIVQMQQKPISDLVKVMGRMIAQSLGEDPNDFASPKPRVIDKTGLTGTYDLTLRFSCDACQFAVANGAVAVPASPGETADGIPNIFEALQKQLGLKLVKAHDIPVEVIVVDHADKTPTGN